MYRYVLYIFVFTPILFAEGLSAQESKDSNEMLIKFEAFKEKEKFLEDLNLFYPGLANKKMRVMLSEKINQLADDFRGVAEKKEATDDKYRDQIKRGLGRFSTIYDGLDSEELERICHYVEELMDIVGLESSEGLLNKFRYGTCCFCRFIVSIGGIYFLN